MPLEEFAGLPGEEEEEEEESGWERLRRWRDSQPEPTPEPEYLAGTPLSMPDNYVDVSTIPDVGTDDMPEWVWDEPRSSSSSQDDWVVDEPDPEPEEEEGWLEWAGGLLGFGGDDDEEEVITPSRVPMPGNFQEGDQLYGSDMPGRIPDPEADYAPGLWDRFDSWFGHNGEPTVSGLPNGLWEEEWDNQEFMGNPMLEPARDSIFDSQSYDYFLQGYEDRHADDTPVETEFESPRDAWENASGLGESLYAYSQTPSENVELFGQEIPGTAYVLDQAKQRIETDSQLPGLDYLQKGVAAAGNAVNQLRNTEAGETVEDAFGDVLGAITLPGQLKNEISLPSGYSVGEYLSAGYQAFQKNIQNFVAMDGSYQFGPEAYKEMVREELVAFEKARGGNIWELEGETLDNALRARLKVGGGAEAVAQTFNQLQSQDEEVDALRAQSLDALSQGDTLLAAELGSAAEELAQKRWTDIIDEQQVSASEMVFELLTDPLNLIDFGASALRLTPILRRAAQGVEAANVGADALRRVDEVATASRAAREAGQLAGANQVGPVSAFFQNKNLTLANQGANSLWGTATRLLRQVETKEQARALLGAFADNPLEMIHGLDDIVVQMGPGIPTQRIAREVGTGVVANEDIQTYMNVLAEAYTHLDDLKAFQGDGTFNVAQGLPELYKLFKESADTVYGIMPENMAMAAAMAPSRIVRGIMSDAFMALKPGYWVKNGLSALGHGITDRAITFEPIANLNKWWDSKIGGMPNVAAAEAFGELKGTAQRMSEGKGMLEPGGSTLLQKVPGLGKVIQKGHDIYSADEERWRLRYLTTIARRTFEEQWDNVISGDFMPVLQSLGIDPKVSRTLGNLASQAGQQGNAQTVLDTLRKSITSNFQPLDFKALGIMPEEVMPETARAINNIVEQYGAGRYDLDNALALVDEAFDVDGQTYSRIMTDTPASPSYINTQSDNVRDYAEVVRDIEAMAKRAGIDPKAASSTIRNMIEQYKDVEVNGYLRLMEEAAQSTVPAVRGILVDTWRNIYDLKTRARAEQGKIFNQANQRNDWGYYTEAVTQMWGEQWKNIERMLGEAQLNIPKAISGEYKPTYDEAWDMAVRSWEVDEQLLTATPRNLGDANYQKIIENSRAYQDKAAATLYATARRYGNDVDSFNHVMSAELDVRKITTEYLGRIADIKENFRFPLAADDLKDYYAQVSPVWQDFWKTTVARYNAASQHVAQEWATRNLVGQTTFKVDDMAGEVTLLGPVTEAAAQPKQAVGRTRNVISQMGDDVPAPSGQLTGGDRRRWKVMDRKGNVLGFDIAESEIPPEILERWKQISSGGAVEARQAVEQIWNELGKVSDWVRRTADDVPGQPGAAHPLSPRTPTPPVPPADDALRKMASDAGISTATEAGKPNNRYLVNTINKDLGLKIKSLDELTDEQRVQAAAALGKRLARLGRETVKETVEDLGFFTLIDDLQTNFLGLVEDAKNDLFDIVGDSVNTIKAKGAQAAPHVGELASMRYDAAQTARQKIKQHMTQMQDGGLGLTPDQQIGVINAVGKLFPKFDNVMQGAINAGENAASFGMLDYGNRKGMDDLLGMFVPYHFWYTRSMKNWMERAIFQPETLSNFARVEGAIEQQNEQAGVPTRAQGQMNITGTDYYMDNPYRLLIPFGDIYETNEFANPERAQTNVGRIVEGASTFGFSPMPHIDAALKAYEDRTDEITPPQQMIPQLRVLSYLYQTITGEPLPGMQRPFDPYGVARQAAVIGSRDDIDPNVTQFARDMAYQSMTGQGPLTEQEYVQGAEQLYQQAMEEMGLGYLLSQVSSMFLGTRVTQITDEERQLNADSNQYWKLGYDAQSNPTGSRAAQTEFMEQNPEITTNWGKNALVPEYLLDEGTEIVRPGERAATSMYWERKDEIFEKMNDAVDTFLMQNPDASRAEWRELKQQFYDEIRDDLEPLFPNRLEGDGQTSFTGMNPFEEATARIDDIIKIKASNEPERPPEGSSQAVMQKYYAEREAWEAENIRALEQRVNQEIRGLSNMDPILSGMADKTILQSLVGTYAESVLRGYKERNFTQREALWYERKELESKWNEQIWDERNERVEEIFGKEGLEIYQTYMNLPKNGPEREAYVQKHPEIRTINMAAYDPEGYAQAIEQFGPDIFELDASYPRGTRDPRVIAFEASLGEQTLERYNQFKEWNGQWYDNFHAEKAKLFGDDIQEFAKSYPAKSRGHSIEERREWAAANPGGYERLKPWWDWQSEQYDAREAYIAANFGSDMLDIYDSRPRVGQNPELAAWYDSHTDEEASRRKAFSEFKSSRYGQDFTPPAPDINSPQAEMLLRGGPDAQPMLGQLSDAQPIPWFEQPQAIYDARAQVPEQSLYNLAADPYEYQQSVERGEAAARSPVPQSPLGPPTEREASLSAMPRLRPETQPRDPLAPLTEQEALDSQFPRLGDVQPKPELRTAENVVPGVNAPPAVTPAERVTGELGQEANARMAMLFENEKIARGEGLPDYTTYVNKIAHPANSSPEDYNQFIQNMIQYRQVSGVAKETEEEKAPEKKATTTGRTRTARRSSGGGGRSRGRGGGGGGGGRGGGSGTAPPAYYRPVARVDPRYMDPSLRMQARYIDPWYYRNLDLSWLYAGNINKPEKLRRWRDRSRG